MAAYPSVPSDVGGFLVWAVGLLILWVIVSIPVYFAGRAVTRSKSQFGRAMKATLLGTIVYFIVFFVVAFFLGAAIGSSAGAFATLLGVLAWLAVYKGAFETGWWGAIGIVVLSWIILVIFDVLLVYAFGVSFPKFYPF